MAASHSSRPIPADPELRARDERLESLKAVIGRLAHDFNNFLAPQLGYINLIRDELPADSDLLRFVVTLENAARKQATSVEALQLAMRPQRRFHPAEFDLKELFVREIRAWEAELPSHIGLKLQVSEPAAPFFGDENQWRNVFKQILANARHALGVGGELQASFEPVQLTSEEARLRGLAGQEHYELTFSDNGIGMTEQARRKAFEPFFTTRTHARDAGIGLTIVHSITQQHGGQVSLESEFGTGTTLKIWAPQKQAFLIERPGGAHHSAGPSPRALLAVTDLVTREILSSWLAELGCELVLAQSRNEAMRYIERMKDIRFAVAETSFDLALSGGLPVLQLSVLPNQEEKDQSSALLTLPLKFEQFARAVRPLLP